jgi:hypothetical protein
MMARRTWKALITMLAVAPLLVEAADGPAPASGGAQADITPPVITHVPQDTYRADMPVRIHARVSDESGVGEVKLFYRNAGEQDCRQISMRRDRGGDFYVAELPPGSGPRIEYYIRASDTVGNTVLGRLFDPYVTTVLDQGEPASPSSAVAIPLSPPPAEQSPVSRSGGASLTPGGASSGLPRWVWIGLGVVAVAAVAAGAGGGGGGGGGSGAPADGGVGTVTITAPVP